MAANTYNAIIIGGGHNGLTAGAYFSRAGANTVVLEADDHVGGAADSSNPFPNHPDVKVSTYSYVVSLVPPTIINDLQLKKFGYNIVPFGPYWMHKFECRCQWSFGPAKPAGAAPPLIDTYINPTILDVGLTPS